MTAVSLDYGSQTPTFHKSIISMPHIADGVLYGQGHLLLEAVEDCSCVVLLC